MDEFVIHRPTARPHCQVTLPQDLDRRADACACYTTQLGYQFGGAEPMRAALADLPEVLLAGERARGVVAGLGR